MNAASVGCVPPLSEPGFDLPAHVGGNRFAGRAETKLEALEIAIHRSVPKAAAVRPKARYQEFSMKFAALTLSAAAVLFVALSPASAQLHGNDYFDNTYSANGYQTQRSYWNGHRPGWNQGHWGTVIR